MRKIIFTILVIVFSAGLGYSQVSTLWEKSAGTSTLPAWFGTDLTRGLAYGNNHVYVVSRTGGSFVYIFNAATGDSIGLLRTDGISGGTYAVSDAEVSSNGVIFVCNLTTSALASPFKVYKYTTEADSPVVAINYTGPVAARLGDKFTVTGSTADNSIIIWAASANTKELYKFTTSDNGATFTATIVPLPSLGSVALGSASVGPLPNSDFYYNAGGQNVQKFLANGTVIDTVSGSIVATGSNSIRFINTLSLNEYFVTFAFGTGNQNGRIVKVPGGDLNLAELVGTTNTLGANANTNGAGDVAVQQVSTFIYNIYVLSTNNGFGAYQLDLRTQLAGDYYIGAAGTGPGGSDPQFATLREAFNVLNNAVFTADCNFYITSNITETYTPAIGLGLAINPAPYTVTFKPYSGVQPVITLNYPTDLNGGPSGALVVGIPMENNIAWTDLRATKNIVIDGSNTVGGTTRDLTIECATTAQRNAFPLTIVGDVSNMVVKNTNIYYKAQGVSTSGNLFVSAVQIRSRSNAGVDFVPHDILFENNHISANFDGVVQSAQGYGTYQSGTPVPLLYPYDITLKNNLIEGKRRSITLYKSGSHDIIGNEIILNQNIAANTTNEAIYAVDVIANSVVNIANNKISKISSMTNLAANGNTAISIESFGTYNIANNMIYGFELTAVNPVAYVRAVKNSSASATLNLAFNSIYMNNLADIGTGTVSYQGLFVSNGTNNFANNIVMSAETDFASYCIYRDLALGTLASDHNDFYPVNTTNGNVGYFNTAATPTLANWQTASSQDPNSYSVDPLFVSATDLHLINTTSPLMGKGMAIPGVTTDFDGETRDSIPEIGADEFPGIIPVELASFSASLVKGDVILNWQTATEINNRGFEIERGIDGQFTTVGFIPGAGTTTEKQSYTFTDKQVIAGSHTYRLKQIDFDGSYSYSNSIEVDVTTPLSFNLSQNYPNPFNPTTKINYSVPFDSKVTISVYSVTGELVMELVNDNVSSGSYSVDFDGSNLASGMYIYKMTAGSFTQTNKMMLMK